MHSLICSLLSATACVFVASCSLVDPEAPISIPGATALNPLDGVNYWNHGGGSSSFVTPRTTETSESFDGAYHVGDYIEVAQPKSPLYSKYPKGGTRPQQYLSQGLVLNVLGIDGSYLHVQNENGEEGYISSMTVVPQGLLLADLPLSEGDVASVDEY